jgi:phosphopantothenoylcysteine decarboxylase/phosphopantothenate--cysteine ligase
VDLLARAAGGMSSDLLTATLLTARCPIVYAPAMHTEMWEHPATAANVALLRQRGAFVINPASGRLTGADTGPGRLPEPDELFAVAQAILSRGHDSGGAIPSGPTGSLSGRRVVISAGGTREELDPVRFLGNWSTGRQGYALARAAALRGADVTVVAANVELPDPAGARVVQVTSAREMHAAMLEEAAVADAVVMTAAVADFRPVARSDSKIKKDGRQPDPIVLAENPDILKELTGQRSRLALEGQVVVGFAAETDPDPDAAQAKLARKGCDLLVVNPVGNGLAFGKPDNEAVIYGADGSRAEVPLGSKEALAEVIWDLVTARLK